MYGLNTTSHISHLDWNNQVDRDVVAVKTALQLHRSACFAGQLAEAWRALTGRNRRLLDLADVRAACPVRNGHYAGMRTVPVCQIRGSEGRCDVVFIHFALHEVPAQERSEVMRALARKLTPGGQLLIREPTEPGHGLQQEEMDTLLTRNGYDRVSSHTQQIPLMSAVCDGVFCVS